MCAVQSQHIPQQLRPIILQKYLSRYEHVRTSETNLQISKENERT